MEISLKNASIIFCFCFFMINGEIDQEFTKPKKTTIKIKAEDYCCDSLGLVKTAGRILQELGFMQELNAELVQGVIENDKNAALKKATQNQLQELQRRQEALHKSLLQAEKELISFNQFVQKLNG